MKKTSFSPLAFLSALGAGGISVIPFAFFQYTHPHPKGLIRFSDIDHDRLSALVKVLFFSLEGVMLVFALLHVFLTVVLLKKLFVFLKTDAFGELMGDPLRNAAILAPFISLAMTMNVVIGPVRFFVPAISENLQTIMPYALAVWMVLYFFLMKMEIKLLKISFVKGFDVSKINFGWLLHPFALGMLTVTGTGIAAMAKDPAVAHLAFFLSLISLSMGMFLLLVKTISIFKSHFAAEGLPEKQFLPSFLIVVPNVTLYAISLFRIGHYLELHQGMHLGPYFLLVTTGAFAFEVWYLAFGLALLKDYFKNHYSKGEFMLSQWGLVCPFVAFAVLGSFVYATFLPSLWFSSAVIVATVVSVVIFVDLFFRHMRCCAGFFGSGSTKCE